MGKTKIFMRDEVLKHIEAPRRAVWGRAGRYLQAGARRRIARRTVALLHIHVPAVSEVREPGSSHKSERERRLLTLN